MRMGGFHRVIKNGKKAGPALRKASHLKRRAFGAKQRANS
jgi:hypothetical protein